MKKLERFERMMKAAQEKLGAEVFHPHDVVNMLRREHAWMRGMVRELLKIVPSFYMSRTEEVQWILDRLEKRRK